MNETKQYHPDDKANAAAMLIDEAIVLIATSSPLGSQEAFANDAVLSNLRKAAQGLADARLLRQQHFLLLAEAHNEE